MEIKEKNYKRKGYAPDLTDSDNVAAVTNILLETIKVGRPAIYPETKQGLEEFKKATIAYLEHVQRINESQIKKKVMVDIESWACYLGTTRATICSYERTRGEPWKQFIGLVKNGIAAVKKEVAFHGQIQPMIAVFDLANNHSYKNTSEFKIEAGPKEPKPREITMEELQARLLEDEPKRKLLTTHENLTQETIEAQNNELLKPNIYQN